MSSKTCKLICEVNYILRKLLFDKLLELIFIGMTQCQIFDYYITFLVWNISFLFCVGRNKTQNTPYQPKCGEHNFDGREIRILNLQDCYFSIQFGKWPHVCTYFQLLLVLSSAVLKMIISFFHYFWCQNWDQWHEMSGKTTHIYILFLLLVQK